MKTQFTCRLHEHVKAIRHFLCGQWKGVGAVGVKRITVAHDLSLHAICLSRGPKYLLCEVEMWLQFFKRNPEILNGHAFGNEFRTVSPNVMRTQPQLLRKHAPVLSGPVQPRATHAGTRLERANLAIRQRQTVDVIAKRKGTGGHFLKQLEPL